MLWRVKIECGWEMLMLGARRRGLQFYAMFIWCLHLRPKALIKNNLQKFNWKKNDTSIILNYGLVLVVLEPVDQSRQLIFKFQISILKGSIWPLCLVPLCSLMAWQCYASPEETRKLLCPMSCLWMMGRMGLMVTMPWKTSWLAVSQASCWCVHSKRFHHISSKWCPRTIKCP